MRNPELAADYVRRSEIRLRAIEVFMEAESWADAVQEYQEAVELALKGLLRHVGVEPPRVHDVSQVLLGHRDRLPEALQGEVEQLARISKDLRRDRELAFYGAEDLTPSGFYTRADAVDARDNARYVVTHVLPHVIAPGDEPSGRGT